MIPNEKKFKKFLRFFFYNKEWCSSDPHPYIEIVINFTKSEYFNTFDKDSLDKIWEAVQKYNEQGCVLFIGFNPRRESMSGRSSTLNVIPVNFALDIDVHDFKLSARERLEQAREERNRVLNELKEYNIHPNAIIRSGNGYHIWLKYKFPNNLDQYDYIQEYRIIQETLIKISGCNNYCVRSIAQLLRLPYSYNRKDHSGKDQIGQVSESDKLVSIVYFNRELNNYESLLKSDIAQKIKEKINNQIKQDHERVPEYTYNIITGQSKIAPCIQTILNCEKEIPEGYRWKTLVVCSIHLFHRGIPVEDAILKCSHIHEEKTEVEEVVRGIYQKLENNPDAYHFGCGEDSIIRKLIDAGITKCEKTICLNNFNDQPITHEEFRKIYMEGKLDLKTALNYLNNHYAITRIKNKFMVIKKSLEQDGENWSAIEFSNFRENFNLYKLKTRRGKLVGVADVWLNSPFAKRYDGIIFDPSKAPGESGSGIFNSWRGFKLQPKRGDCSYIKKHIEHIWCNDDPNLYNYVYSWFRSILEKPGERTRVALVIIGEKGAGKCAPLIYFSKILYPWNFIELADKRVLRGNFNSPLSEKILVIFDEAINSLYDSRMDCLIKNYITEESIVINKKYIPSHTEKNCANIVFLSNNEHVVMASDIERRFFCLRISDEMCETKYKLNDPKRMEVKKYWDNFWREANGDGPAAFMYFLLHEFENIVELREIPETTELQNQRDRTHGITTDVRKFLENICEYGMFKDGIDSWSTEPYIKDLYESFKKWFPGSRLDVRYFGIALRKIIPNLKRNTNMPYRYINFPNPIELRSLLNLPIDEDMEDIN